MGFRTAKSGLVISVGLLGSASVEFQWGGLEQRSAKNRDFCSFGVEDVDVGIIPDDTMHAS